MNASRNRLVLLTTLALLACAGTLPAQEARLVAYEAAAIYPLDGESTLIVEGLQGELAVRLGKEPQLRFHSIRLADREEVELELWSEGGALVLRAPEGAAEVPRLVQVAVPERMRVRVALSGMKVSASGLRDDLEIEGAGLELDVRGIAGAMDLELEGGRAFIGSCDGALTLSGREFDAELSFLDGEVDVDATSANLRMKRMNGALRLILDQGSLNLQEARSTLELEAEDAEVELRGLEQGGELRLRSSRVALRECKGDLTVETDSEVQFNEMEATLHINNWGGSVRGSGNKGLVEIKTEGAQVMVEKIEGPLRVEGDRLELSAKEVAGELLIYATSSTVQIEDAAAGATVENEFGDVVIRRSKQTVRVNSRDGDVRVLEHSGIVEVDAEGPAVEVGWAMVGRDQDSRIENASGNVTLHFPANGACRIEARSNFGRIETDLPDVRISDDGNVAAGMLGRATRPTVHVVSEGDVYLMSGAGSAEE